MDWQSEVVIKYWWGDTFANTASGNEMGMGIFWRYNMWEGLTKGSSSAKNYEKGFTVLSIYCIFNLYFFLFW